MNRKLKPQVGQTVQFTDSDGIVCFDTIEDISNNIIEGKQYDLTYIDYEVINFIN